MSQSSFTEPSLEVQLMDVPPTQPPMNQLTIIFPMYLLYVMAYILMFLSMNIVLEKEKKIMDNLVMMGMKMSAYW